MRFFLIVASYLLHACQADANNLVMMYKASEKECGQALLKESWVLYAKRFAGLRVGSCPGEGYTVVTKKMNMKVPVVGFTVRVQMYKKDFHHVGKAHPKLHLASSLHSALESSTRAFRHTRIQSASSARCTLAARSTWAPRCLRRDLRRRNYMSMLMIAA
mmetsp:Transcript_67026/g.157251  ORF Transcript_67026/g.157251 Transcript_67026/m.157251 type:complete len:160 (+) Transcript_67026:158-637(+)